MKKKNTLIILFTLWIMMITGIANASVNWALEKTLNLGETPLDVGATYDGRWTFVLTDKGNVLVFYADGILQDRIPAGKDVDRIEVSPRGDRLYLSNRKEKTIKVLSIDFIKKIDISNSPFKGPENAPVVIAVFNDFQ